MQPKPNDIPPPPPPPRPDDSHKGTFGTAIIVGGCETMIGAPALCARAALRAGAGLVKVACPADILPFVLTIEPSATGIALGHEPADALAQIDMADPDHKAVLAVGPGLGTESHVGELVTELLAGDRPIVLDADGLNLLAKLCAGAQPPAITAPLVLTPHPGEYRRLAGALRIDADPVGDEATRAEAAALLAKRLDAVVVLKGKNSVISDGQQHATNPTGNPALATAGTGDVLTGTLASLIAQGMPSYDAARLACYAHGLAADYWAQRNGHRGLRAIELADALPNTFQALKYN